MNRSSCIRHPENNRYIQLHAWQVKFCQNNHCAALLLSYFIAWHDWKLRNDQYYRRSNDIAETHGDGRPHNENAYLFFTSDELIDGCMGLYGKKAISEGLELLVFLKVISVHKNPNPRYHFDKTKYFQFYPHVCNLWISENYSIDGKNLENNTQAVDYYDSAKRSNRYEENASPSSESIRPCGESSRAITDTTNNTTNKNKSIKSRVHFDEENKVPDSEEVMALLQYKGFSKAAMQYPDVPELIIRLINKGAKISDFEKAYDIAAQATHTKGSSFGMRYLAKVMDDLLSNPKPISQPRNSKEKNTIYENDFHSGLSWMGDLANQ